MRGGGRFDDPRTTTREKASESSSSSVGRVVCRSSRFEFVRRARTPGEKKTHPLESNSLQPSPRTIVSG